jgi:exonuclease III
MNLVDMFRTFHPKTKEYTIFSVPQGTFSKTDHVTGYKTSLNI